VVKDPAIASQLQAITKQMYLAMDGDGYARTDIRMDANGRFYLLEINPNPSIFYPDHDGATADFILMLDGYGKAKFLDTLIENALNRQYGRERPERRAISHSSPLESVSVGTSTLSTTRSAVCTRSQRATSTRVS
jgi:hypothetical protein